MCGICGVYAFGDSAPPVNERMLVAMRDTMTHRGPDDQGVYLSADCRLGLGSRRLNIIDLSSAGRQPMCNEDGTVWIVYNGEIYNFKDHRAELQAHGHVFRSHTDTEVIVHLYEEHGADLVHHLRGMFAFAIWDARKRQLFLARDRLGIKPLYYALRDGQFLFASEIKAILKDPAVPRAVDDQALYHYLTFLTTPAPLTLFKDIYKLPAGHRMLLDARGQLQSEEYWDVFDHASASRDRSAAECADELLGSLRESIRLRMISDVPFGVFLSGGIDSSTNTVLMAEQMDRPVQTFSIGFERQPKHNEFEYARLVASRLHTDHRETSIGVRELIEFLPKMVYHQDEPIADPVCVPVYYLAKLAKASGVTVIQVGEGADELFAYPGWAKTVQHYWLWQGYRMLPGILRRATTALVGQFRDGHRADWLRRGACGEELFWGGAEAFTEVQKRKLVSERLREKFRDQSSHQIIAQYRKRFLDRSPLPDDYLAWMGYLDLHLRLPELLLMRVDKMTMAASVEARVPFLDHRFVELAMSMPQSIKLDGTGAKHLLKQAVNGLVPDEIIQRPKQGFGSPISEWLSGELGEIVEDKLSAFVSETDLFDPAAICELLAQRREELWVLFNLALWHQEWM